MIHQLSWSSNFHMEFLLQRCRMSMLKGGITMRLRRPMPFGPLSMLSQPLTKTAQLPLQVTLEYATMKVLAWRMVT